VHAARGLRSVPTTKGGSQQPDPDADCRDDRNGDCSPDPNGTAASPAPRLSVRRCGLLVASHVQIVPASAGGS
jgi:hypothetical protein